MVKKVLVAIDPSAASQRAFSSALELADGLNAELVLVHALDVFDPASPEHPNIHSDSYSIALDSLVRQTYEQEWAEFVEHSEALLKQKQAEAEALGLTTQYLQPYGRPGPAICRTAKTTHADLIVVGSRGHNDLTELILGSVSNYILHHAPCSVILVHPKGLRQDAADSQRAAAATA